MWLCDITVLWGTLWPLSVTVWWYYRDHCLWPQCVTVWYYCAVSYSQTLLIQQSSCSLYRSQIDDSITYHQSTRDQSSVQWQMIDRHTQLCLHYLPLILGKFLQLVLFYCYTVYSTVQSSSSSSSSSSYDRINVVKAHSASGLRYKVSVTHAVSVRKS